MERLARVSQIRWTSKLYVYHQEVPPFFVSGYTCTTVFIYSRVQFTLEAHHTAHTVVRTLCIGQCVVHASVQNIEVRHGAVCDHALDVQYVFHYYPGCPV